MDKLAKASEEESSADIRELESLSPSLLPPGSYFTESSVSLSQGHHVLFVASSIRNFLRNMEL